MPLPTASWWDCQAFWKALYAGKLGFLYALRMPMPHRNDIYADLGAGESHNTQAACQVAEENRAGCHHTSAREPATQEERLQHRCKAHDSHHSPRSMKAVSRALRTSRSGTSKLSKF